MKSRLKRKKRKARRARQAARRQWLGLEHGLRWWTVWGSGLCGPAYFGCYDVLLLT